MRIYILSLAIIASLSASEPSSDNMEWLDNGQIRLGVDLNLGGAITWLSESKSKRNIINHHDWGREIQMSFYSGPVPYTENGKQPHPAWKQLGWNPIQAGDVKRNRSRVLSHKNDGKQLHIRCVPMQWPLDNVPGECVFESTLRLEGRTVQATARLINARSDKTQYQARSQELPAVYTIGELHRLITYTGDKPFTDEPTTVIVRDPAEKKRTGFPWERFEATERWAALVDDKGNGLGVWMPTTQTWLGGFSGKPGAGGPLDAPTGYLAPIRNEILDHNITYEFSYVLIFGSITEIRQYVRKNSTPDTSPQWDFASSRESWTYRNAHDGGWPIKGSLTITVDGANPQVLSPTGLWSARANPAGTLQAAIRSKATTAQLWWRGLNEQFSPERHITFPIRGDGSEQTYQIPLHTHKLWTGNIAALRLGLSSGHAAGDTIILKRFALGRK